VKFALGETGFGKWKVASTEVTASRALASVGQTKETITAAYLANPSDATLAKTMSLVIDAADALLPFNEYLIKTKLDLDMVVNSEGKLTTEYEKRTLKNTSIRRLVG